MPWRLALLVVGAGVAAYVWAARTGQFDDTTTPPVRTVIEDEVFVGYDTQLVAPVTVGRGATLGAGTTLTKDAPAGELTLARAKQLTLSGWKRPVKQKKEG